MEKYRFATPSRTVYGDKSQIAALKYLIGIFNFLKIRFECMLSRNKTSLFTLCFFLITLFQTQAPDPEARVGACMSRGSRPSITSWPVNLRQIFVYKDIFVVLSVYFIYLEAYLSIQKCFHIETKREIEMKFWNQKLVC